MPIYSLSSASEMGEEREGLNEVGRERVRGRGKETDRVQEADSEGERGRK